MLKVSKPQLMQLTKMGLLVIMKAETNLDTTLRDLKMIGMPDGMMPNHPQQVIMILILRATTQI